MTGFVAELKRRNVFRVGVFYAVTAWLILQVADVLIGLINLPDFSLRFVGFVLLLGFPVALVLSWVYELTPEGVRRESEVDRTHSVTPDTGRRLNVATLLVGAIAIALVAWQQFGGASSPGTRAERNAQDARDSGADPATEVPAVPGPGDGPVTLAVLPFVNMSPDPDQEYFSDGLTEELLNTLVKVPGMLVAARTSAFSYKNTSMDVRKIGGELDVAHIVEGSVRKAGDDLRITAQLIRVSDGFHLWSETYDRKLDNIFAVQEEIAGEVAAALQIPLGLDAPPLVGHRTDSFEAYDRYLEARQLLRRREDFERSIRILEEVVLEEPDFAPAWAALAYALEVVQGYQSQLAGQPIDFAVLARRSEAAARRAVELDASLPEGHHALGNVLRSTARWAEAEAAYRRAVDLDPASLDILEDWRQFLAEVGRVDESVRVARRAFELEPRSAIGLITYADSLYVARRFDASLELSRRAEAAQPGFQWPQFLITDILLYEGRYEEALETARACDSCRSFAWFRLEIEALESLAAGGVTDVEFELEDIYRTGYPMLLWRLGGADLVLATLERNAVDLQQGEAVYLQSYFNAPFMDEVRQTDRYLEIVRAFGLAAYWAEAGPPDYCDFGPDGDLRCGAYRSALGPDYPQPQGP